MPRRLAFPKRSHPRTDYPHARRGPLDNRQKAALCILAREAFEHLFGVVPDSQATLDAWRHEETRKAIGIDSLRFAGQEHYPPLLAHFLNLKGESGKAFNVTLSHQTSGRDLAWAKLQGALRDKNLPEAYAAAICQRQNQCTLDRATEKQLWRLVFTIINRGNAAKRKANHQGTKTPSHEEDPY